MTYRTAREELDDALQHMAPALVGYVDAQLPNQKVHELADAIGRAVHVAARRQAAALFADARDYVETLWTTVGLADALNVDTDNRLLSIAQKIRVTEADVRGPYEHRGAYAAAPEVQR
jgi:hypothetical protein